MTSFGPRLRFFVAAICIGSAMGAATTWYHYNRHAEVWLRDPPKMPECVRISQRLLAHETAEKGSIPIMLGETLGWFLRPSEVEAVACISRFPSSTRLSGPVGWSWSGPNTTAERFSLAFINLNPDARARILAETMREISPDSSADREARAAYLIATAAIEAMPKTPEIEALEEGMAQRYACRFVTRTPCASRPPIPDIVWIAGIPSTFGIVGILGLAMVVLGARAHAVGQRNRLAKKARMDAAARAMELEVEKWSGS